MKHHTNDRSEVKDSQGLHLRGENRISVNQTGKEEGKRIGTNRMGMIYVDRSTDKF